jgi:nucleoside-diphosphate-sugar epimerase
VFVSSIMAYDQGLVGVLPWYENMAMNRDGEDTYGGFKAQAENAMMLRHFRSGFPATVVRPAAIYGPDNNIFDMETPMFLRLREHRPILLPHGGMVSASYGHVNDLCSLMVSMTGNSASFGEVFNVTAEAVTTRRYVDTLAAIVGEEPSVVVVPDAALAGLSAPVFGHLFGARHHAVLSIDKARTLLGFAPQFDLRSGHEDTYAWFLQQGMHKLDGPLADPVWRASWNFQAEADFAATLGTR